MKVITYGTFDTLHFGHFELLRRAKALGNELIVGVSTDEFNKTKGKESCFPYLIRKSWVESLKFVDHVIPESSWLQKERDIKQLKVDLMVMGDDWKGKFDHLPCRIIYLPRTPQISSTLIKGAMQNCLEEYIAELLPPLDSTENRLTSGHNYN